MASFLDLVAADLYARYGNELSHCCLVFPNRRSRLFFAQSLSKLITKPLWQPNYQSIEEVIEALSGRRTSDTFTLLLELYEVYTRVLQSDEPFDRFYFWGDVMLHDFDLIDKYLINAEALFKNLKAQKELEGDLSFLSEEQIAHIRQFWSSFSPQESELQHRFITVWEALWPIYSQYRQQLSAKGMAYEGMLYREAATAPLPEKLHCERFVFIGFNALNECEKALFRQLKQLGKADFYWDYDIYYLNNKQQEAGSFLRRNIAEFPSPLPAEGFANFQQAKEIHIIAAPSDAVQAKLTPQLMRDMEAPADRRTAVVLADEQLLIPTLHALPAVANDINVTMGYPLRQTPVYALIELLLRLHRKAKTTNQHTRFYYQDVLPLLQHPYIKAISNNASQRYADDMVKNNKVYVSPEDFSGDPSLSAIFTPAGDHTELYQRLSTLLDNIAAAPPDSENEKMVRAYVLHCSRQLNKLKKAIDESNVSLSLQVFSNMLYKLFAHESIPFTGEPLSGLQVLGILETRNLDFENVILLSANEGVLPQSFNVPSFIPYNLRRGFGLPAIEQHEAVFAYYFYRLLQRAQKITLVYNTKTDEARTGEASRYLAQLLMESGHTVRESSVSFHINIQEPAPITVQKDEAVMRELYKYIVESGELRVENEKHSSLITHHSSLSPSALNAYIACPMRFYFRYIARLKTPDEMTEDVDSRLLGNLLHRAMETLYTPFEGKSVTADELKSLAGNHQLINQAMDSALAQEYYHNEQLPEEAADNGKLLLLRDVVLRYIRQIIQYDIARAPFTLEEVEKKFEHIFTFAVNGNTMQACLGGIIDRKERQGNTVSIIDYKTGAVKNKFNSVDALFGNEAKQHNAGVLQVMLYSVLLKLQQPDKEFIPKLYAVRELYNNETDFLITEQSAKQEITAISPYVDSFTAALDKLLRELFNPAQAFVQTTDNNTCKYCDYRQVCRR